MARGIFVLIEGLDRAGKSTLSRKIADALRARSHRVHQLGFPERSSPIGQKINEYLKSTANIDDRAIHLLFSANRWEHSQDIVKRLRDGECLVADRYAMSGVAYSSAKGLDREWCKNPDKGLPSPDVVVYLRADPKQLAERGGFGEERYEKIEFQNKVGQAFDGLKEENWIVVDALGSQDLIFEQVMAQVDSVLLSAPNNPIRCLWTEGDFP